MLQLLAPILGGLIASRSAKKQQQQQQQYAEQALQEQRVYDRGTLQRIRDDALESGFNPLSVLRNGGTSIGSNTYLQAPALSSNDFFAQGLMQAIDTGFNAPQRELDRETQRLQNDLYRAQIGELQANTAYLARSHGFGVPAVEQYGVSSDEVSGGRDNLPALRTDPADHGGAGPDSYNRNVAPELTLFGVDLYGSGRFSSGQTQEDSIGDGGPLQWAIQPFILDDMIRTTSAMHQYSFGRANPTYLPDNVNTVDWIRGGWKN